MKCLLKPQLVVDLKAIWQELVWVAERDREKGRRRDGENEGSMGVLPGDLNHCVTTKT